MADIIKKIFGGTKYRLTDMRDETHERRYIAHPPFDLLTDGGDGSARRIRVDSNQTGFFAGREARTFREWTAPATATYVIKAAVPIDIILMKLQVTADQGSARVQTVVGGTEGGTFSETLPTIRANTMSNAPAYTPQVSLTAGGTHTGGTILDVLRVNTDSNTNRSATVGGTEDDQRGVGANTYYFRLTLDAFVGVFRARWEERPEGTY